MLFCLLIDYISFQVFLWKRIGKTIQNIAEALCGEKGLFLLATCNLFFFFLVINEIQVIKFEHQIGLKGSVSQGSLISKVLKRVAKYCAAMTMIVETNQENSFE